jgi:hypothetical protein
MRATIISLLSLVALATAAALPQAEPPIERCKEADTGKVCNAGEINGFKVTGTCTEIPSFNQQFVCLPLGTLLGGQPAPKN